MFPCEGFMLLFYPFYTLLNTEVGAMGTTAIEINGIVKTPSLIEGEKRFQAVVWKNREVKIF